MRIRSLIWVLLILLAGALNFPAADVDAAPSFQEPYPEGDRRYFEQSGYSVYGPFLEFFETRGGMRIFGYPQTRIYYDSSLGLYTQYFDNVRMEWHPYNSDPYKVQLGLLGEELGYRAPPLPRSEWQSNSRFRRIFPETGHVVSFAFLDFYDNHGGLDIFGYPISEPMLDEERGYIVQYFQRMRMEWHPERSREERVVLGELGNEYIYQEGVPDTAFERGGSGIIEQNTPVSTSSSSLRVWAAVRHAITGREGEQTVFVYVTDTRREPVEGAEVTVSVHYTSNTVSYSLPSTNAQGLTDVEFTLNSPPPGRRVVIDVAATYGGTQGTTQTFFLPWW